MKNNFWILFILLTAIGCTQEEKSDVWSGKDFTITHEILYPDDFKIGMFRPETIYDSTMIIKHSGCQNAYSIWSIKDDSLFFRDEFLSRGEGPLEIIIPETYTDYGQNRLIISAPHNGEHKTFCIDLSHPEQIANPDYWKPFYWKKQTKSVSSLCPVDSTTYLVMGPSLEHNMFGLFDMLQDTLRPLDSPYPSVGKDMNTFQNFRIFQGTVLRHPDKSKFIYSIGSWGRYSFIFDVNNGIIENTKILSEEIPDCGIAQDGLNVSFGKESHRSYKIWAGRQHIYFMYNDFTLDDFIKNKLVDGLPMDYYSKILVFDWDGQPVKRLLLDIPVFSFGIDRDEKYLYAVTDRIVEDNETVVRFKL